MFHQVISIMTDYQCNFECAHCSVGSSPKTKMPMPWELYMDLIRQLRQVDGIKVVCFTGGEATLRKEWLLDAIAVATQAGFRTRVVTNGWWARTPEKARQMVQELREAGLEELNTSYDDYHAPFAPMEKIVNLVRATLETDMRLAIAVVNDANAVHSGERIRDELVAGIPISIEQLQSRVFFIEDGPTPSGTGQDLDVKYVNRHIEVGCSDIGKSISIHPNGLVKACCGHAMFETPDLTIGSLYNEPLQNMLDRCSHNLLYWWIHSYGPKKILDRLGIGGEYASQCHACYALLATPEHRAKLHAFMHEHRDDIFVNDVLLGDSLSRMADAATLTPDEADRRGKLVFARRQLPVIP